MGWTGAGTLGTIEVGNCGLEVLCVLGGNNRKLFVPDSQGWPGHDGSVLTAENSWLWAVLHVKDTSPFQMLPSLVRAATEGTG